MPSEILHYSTSNFDNLKELHHHWIGKGIVRCMVCKAGPAPRWGTLDRSLAPLDHHTQHVASSKKETWGNHVKSSYCCSFPSNFRMLLRQQTSPIVNPHSWSCSQGHSIQGLLAVAGCSPCRGHTACILPDHGTITWRQHPVWFHWHELPSPCLSCEICHLCLCPDVCQALIKQTSTYLNDPEYSWMLSSHINATNYVNHRLVTSFYRPKVWRYKNQSPSNLIQVRYRHSSILEVPKPTTDLLKYFI